MSDYWKSMPGGRSPEESDDHAQTPVSNGDEDEDFDVFCCICVDEGHLPSKRCLREVGSLTSTIEITTFGFQHGPAPRAHLIVDLRDHFKELDSRPDLQGQAGHAAVFNAVVNTPGTGQLMTGVEDAVVALLANPPAGLSRVTLAVGCTTGRYSAEVGDGIGTTLEEDFGAHVTLTHREASRNTAS
ncbi:hypothetical protein ACGFJT_37025 [Actinomadura geliboluensis]|uniref:RapZ C-terminal domain-containing protein n=1 Tax=Actinomadura geliboluensis TaxID=882440 RepID=UPI0037136E0E